MTSISQEAIMVRIALNDLPSLNPISSWEDFNFVITQPGKSDSDALIPKSVLSQVIQRALGLEGAAENLTEMRAKLDNLSGAEGASAVGFSQFGIGSIVRTTADKLQDAISPEDFGAVGDGTPHPLSEFFTTLEEAQLRYPFVTSLSQSIDWAALQAAVNTGAMVQGRPTSTYWLTQDVVAQDADLFFNGNNCKIISASSEQPAFQALGTYGPQHTVTEITVDSVDFTKGQGGSPTQTHILHVADSSEFFVGDVIKVISDDLIDESRDGDRERKGEHAVVALVEPGKIGLYSFLYETYITGVRVSKMSSKMRVDVGHFISDYLTPGVGPVVTCTGVYAPQVGHIVIPRCKSEGVRYNSCVAARTTAIHCDNATTDFTARSYGYVVIEYSCEFGTHTNLYGHQVRHVYTDGTLIAQIGDSRTERYGRTKGSTISDSKGWLCQNSPFDTHWTSVAVQFVNCVSFHGFSGPNSSQRSFQLRGRAGRLIDCVSFGGTGVRIQQVVDHPLSCHGNVVRNFTHHFTAVSQGRSAVHVLGQTSSANPPVVIIDGLTTYQDNDATQPQVLVEYAAAYLKNSNLQARQGGQYLASVFFAGPNGRLEVSDSRIDTVGSQAVGQRLCSMGANSSIYLRGVTVDGPITYLLDAKGNDDAVFDCQNVHFETAPTSAAGFTNSTSPNIRIDYTVGKERINPLGSLNATYNSGGSKTIELQRRSCRSLQFNAVVNVPANGNTNISLIESGMFDGQELILRNSPASQSSLRIGISAVPSIGTTREIPPGTSMRLTYSVAAGQWEALLVSDDQLRKDVDDKFNQQTIQIDQLNTRNRGVVSIREFGAVLNGTTNDTAALLAFIAHCGNPANNVRGVIDDGTLALDSINATIEGDLDIECRATIVNRRGTSGSNRLVSIRGNKTKSLKWRGGRFNANGGAHSCLYVVDFAKALVEIDEAYGISCTTSSAGDTSAIVCHNVAKGFINPGYIHDLAENTATQGSIPRAVSVQTNDTSRSDVNIMPGFLIENGHSAFVIGNLNGGVLNIFPGYVRNMTDNGIYNAGNASVINAFNVVLEATEEPIANRSSGVVNFYGGAITNWTNSLGVQNAGGLLIKGAKLSTLGLGGAASANLVKTREGNTNTGFVHIVDCDIYARCQFPVVDFTVGVVGEFIDRNNRWQYVRDTAITNQSANLWAWTGGTNSFDSSGSIHELHAANGDIAAGDYFINLAVNTKQSFWNSRITNHTGNNAAKVRINSLRRALVSSSPTFASGGNSGEGEVNAGALEVAAPREVWVASMPSAGYWVAGTRAKLRTPTLSGDAGSRILLKGWVRLTTGSDNVVDVDWAADRSPTGT